MEQYEKTDEKARELLRRLATSEPYYRRQRQLQPPPTENDEVPTSPVSHSRYGNGPGPIRTSESRRGTAFPGRGRGRGGGVGGGRRQFPSTAQLPPTEEDILPPADPNVTSLFITGVEDDLPEYTLRSFFSQFGPLRSLICSHRSHCAFANFLTREGAEAAAKHCQGKAVIQGCPLRIRWGKPKALDSMDREERLKNAREGRQVVTSTTTAATATIGGPEMGKKAITAAGEELSGQQRKAPSYVVAPPPGSDNVKYSSLSGD